MRAFASSQLPERVSQIFFKTKGSGRARLPQLAEKLINARSAVEERRFSAAQKTHEINAASTPRYSLPSENHLPV
jgi:hypothetical protein